MPVFSLTNFSKSDLFIFSQPCLKETMRVFFESHLLGAVSACLGYIYNTLTSYYANSL